MFENTCEIEGLVDPRELMKGSTSPKFTEQIQEKELEKRTEIYC